MFKVNVFTNGVCSSDIGGYGAILSYKEHELVVRGYEKGASSNRMELMAVLAAVNSLKKPCEVEVYTKSKYLCQCATHKKSWLTDKDRPNGDLWEQLISAAKTHKIAFKKIDDTAMCERCRNVAKEQVVKCRHEMLG